MVRRRPPKHLADSPIRLKVLRRMANHLRGHYGLPVYLCGSALVEHNKEPRDWDVRIEMPDAEFAERFGDVDRWVQEGGTGAWTIVRWRWSDECVKQTKWCWGQTNMNIDFQIYPAKHCKNFYGTQPKYRLDTRRGK